MRFLSTPSARRATRPQHRPARGYPISIHALREEGDACGAGATLLAFLFLSTPSARRATGAEAFPLRRPGISIHALREEGDASKLMGLPSSSLFLSTPSARRATVCEELRRRMFDISIHALREEGDRPSRLRLATGAYFYPRPPRGGRHGWGQTVGRKVGFLSTPSARRATAKTETKSLFSNKLYNILHEFRRALIYNGSKNYPNHAK